MVKITINVCDQTEESIFRSVNHIEDIDQGVKIYEKITNVLIGSGASIVYKKDSVVNRTIKLQFNIYSIILTISNKNVGADETANDILQSIIDTL